MPRDEESGASPGAQSTPQLINVYNNTYPVCALNMKTDRIEELF